MNEIYTYNAGKGDCIRVRFGKGHNIIIDTGVARFAQVFKLICDKILSESETLDLLILTHVDSDHIGGILSLLRLGWKCPFKEVRMNLAGVVGSTNAQLSNQQNDEVYRRLSKQKMKILPMLAGDNFYIGGAKITTLSPITVIQKKTCVNTPLAHRRDYGKSMKQLAVDPITKKDSSPNNKNSIIFIWKFERKSILFTGDAWAEDIISGLGNEIHHFDFVKLPHHGSVGNISEQFKNYIDCQNFLICTDGIAHPDKQTIAKLATWYGKINIFSPSDWWSNGFFISNDNKDIINLIYKEGLESGWKI